MFISTIIAAGALLMAGAQAGPVSRQAPACGAVTWPDFERRFVAAQAAFQKANPEPLLALWSHRDDVALMGALGGHERGWPLVGSRLRRISAMNSGVHEPADIVARFIGADVAMVVQIEHITQHNLDGSVRSRDHLRVTHGARCEGRGWRVVHRHADFRVESQLPAK